MSKKKNNKNTLPIADEMELLEHTEMQKLEDVGEDVTDFAETDGYAPLAEEYLEESNGPRHEKSKTISPVRIVLSLTLICVFIAGMLGAVNAVTKAKISENADREKVLAIQKIFGSSSVIEEYPDGVSENVTEAYLIFKSNMLYGYCVNVCPSGFGGEISMMVGVDYTGSVCGVNIVSMAETPGLGSKVNTNDFLSQFVGKTGSVSIGSGIDAISGATVSSEAVCSGINTALSAGIDLLSISEARLLTIYSEELDTAPPEPETTGVVEETESATQVPQIEDSNRLEDTVEYVDDVGNANAPVEERPAVDITVYYDTMVYETETTALDSDMLTEEEEETTTPPPETTTETPETTTKKEETTEKPETTTKEPEKTTEEPATTEKIEETTGTAEETTESAAETTGVADETDGEEGDA